MIAYYRTKTFKGPSKLGIITQRGKSVLIIMQFVADIPRNQNCHHPTVDALCGETGRKFTEELGYAVSFGGDGEEEDAEEGLGKRREGVGGKGGKRATAAGFDLRGFEAMGA